MKKLLSLLILAFAIQTSAQQKPAAPKKTQPAPAAAAAKSITAKITEYLQKQPSYTKVSDGIWLVRFEGKSLGEFDVMVATAPDAELIIIAVAVAEKKNLRLSQDLLFNILKFNGEADQVKAGFDDDGDLFLRAEINGRLVDLQEFKQVLEQTAAAADKLHGQISGSLIPAATP